MGSKSAIKSKTINFNAVMLLVISAVKGLGIDVPDEFYPAMLALVPLVNIALRIVTNGAVTLTSKPAGQDGRAALALLSGISLVCIAVLPACTTTTTDVNGNTVATETQFDSEKALTSARLIARKAGKYVGRNNPEVAEKVTEAYAEMAALDDDAFRGKFLDGLDWYLSSRGISGSDELREDAGDILDLFGFNIDLTTIDLAFLQRFQVESIKSVAQAFIQGLNLAV